LIYRSGPHIFDYIYSVPKEKILSILGHLFVEPDHIFSHEYCWVASDSDRITGVCVMYPNRDIKRLEKNMRKYGKLFLKYMSLPALLGIPFRGRIDRLFPELDKDALYISNLAVDPDFRRKGVATFLLQKSVNHAGEIGCGVVSLYVDINNDPGIQLYQKFGFSIKATSEFPEKYHKHDLFGFHLMSVRV
jgi:ribosomal protein S18 acetylase RimI-like enzyme